MYPLFSYALMSPQLFCRHDVEEGDEGEDLRELQEYHRGHKAGSRHQALWCWLALLVGVSCGLALLIHVIYFPNPGIVATTKLDTILPTPIETGTQGLSNKDVSFDEYGRYIHRDCGPSSKAFTSFLPGIGISSQPPIYACIIPSMNLSTFKLAGVQGHPLWAFYVNRGQGIASFGTRDKVTTVN